MAEGTAITVEELEELLAPLLSQLEQSNQITVIIIALFGVLAGVLLMLMLFRRF